LFGPGGTLAGCDNATKAAPAAQAASTPVPILAILPM
jgi:hypothetical protein